MKESIFLLIFVFAVAYIDVSDLSKGDPDLRGFPTHGVLYAFLVVSIGFVGSLSETHSFFQLNMMGLKAKTALTSAIFRKCLKLKQPRGKSM